MKLLFFCLLYMIPLATTAQAGRPMPENGIYVSDSGFLLHRLQDGFDNKKGYRLNNNRKNYLIIRTADSRDTFYFDAIWGFRKNGKDWQVYNNEFYKVDYIDTKICLYDIPGTGQGEGVHTIHYFSSSISSPVHHLSKQDLLSVYHDNPSFTNKIKSMHLTESILRWDKKSGMYLFMTWL